MLDVLLGRIVLNMELLPADAKVVNVNADWHSQTIQFLVESESYDEVPVGQYPPSELGIKLFVIPPKEDEVAAS